MEAWTHPDPGDSEGALTPTSFTTMAVVDMVFICGSYGIQTFFSILLSILTLISFVLLCHILGRSFVSLLYLLSELWCCVFML